jgi:3',5'-cyclic AMP phosphodiesterase CpdA
MIRVGVGLPILALALLQCPSGYRRLELKGAVPSFDEHQWDRVDCTRKALAAATDVCAERKLPKLLIQCSSGDRSERERCFTSPGRRETRVLPQPESGLVSRLTFVHLSDAQLKEETIHLAGPISETHYDGLKSTSDRNDELEKHDDAVLLATVMAINELDSPEIAPAFAPFPAPRRPSFVVHTGDAVDAGVYSELLQFITVMDALEVPWLSVVGNHDNMFFGTFPPNLMSGLDILVPFIPIVDTDRFMKMHSTRGLDQDSSLPHPAGRGADHPPTTHGRIGFTPRGDRVIEPHGSSFHGFDLACPKRGLIADADQGKLCAEARGYYAFDTPLDGGGTLRAIVLNTAEVVPTTAFQGTMRQSTGNMLPEQIRWLKRELAEDRPGIAEKDKRKSLFIVFGHHDLRSFWTSEQADELRSIFLHEPRLLAYVAGHRHANDVVAWERKGGAPFWEILGGSTLVYPQLGHVIDLLEGPEAKLYLRVTPFRQQLGDGDVEAIDPTPARVAPPSPPEPGASPAKPPVCPGLEGSTSWCHRLAKRASQGREGARLDVKDEDHREEHNAVEKVTGALFVGTRPKQ